MPPSGRPKQPHRTAKPNGTKRNERQGIENEGGERKGRSFFSRKLWNICTGLLCESDKSTGKAVENLDKAYSLSLSLFVSFPRGSLDAFHLPQTHPEDRGRLNYRPSSIHLRFLLAKTSLTDRRFLTLSSASADFFIVKDAR